MFDHEWQSFRNHSLSTSTYQLAKMVYDEPFISTGHWKDSPFHEASSRHH